MAINNPVISDSDILQGIAVAIQAKDGGGKMYDTEMRGRIEALQVAEPVVENPALALMDWEGTTLKEYSKEDALALTELPNPSTLSKYADVDHELLTFQGWNWSLADIKDFAQSRKNECLLVGSKYTSSNGQTNNFWRNPRLESTADAIYMQKRAATIGNYSGSNKQTLEKINVPNGSFIKSTQAFENCYSLHYVTVADGAINLDANIFRNCYNLKRVSLPKGIALISYGMFQYCYTLENIVIPDSVTSIRGYSFNNCIALKKIIIPNDVIEIKANAFSKCENLSSIALPKNLITIEAEAFSTCPNLVDVVIKGKPELTNVNAFLNNNANELFYVSQADLSWFETATNWSTFYTQNKIVTIEDNIAYLESIGIDVDEYKGV